MALTPRTMALVGARLLRAALESDPSVLADEAVGDHVVAAGRAILGIDGEAA